MVEVKINHRLFLPAVKVDLKGICSRAAATIILGVDASNL